MYQFTIISAVYNVDRYLGDFIKSIEQQTYGLDRVQVLVINDGSTDGSLATLDAWSARHPESVRVISKENGGQASARNLGIDLAEGQWVTFIDPDDYVAEDYLERVAKFIDGHPQVDMVATHRLLLQEADGVIENQHPLRFMFSKRGKDRLVSLNKKPEYFHGHAPSTFFRHDRLASLGLKYDDRIRPNFEDGHFCTEYLLSFPEPKVGFVASASYIYRKRADSSSTLQTSVAHPGRLTNVLRYGYLDVLKDASERYASVPQWLQNFIIYELRWYLSAEFRFGNFERPSDPAIIAEFHDLLQQILDLLDDSAIEEFNLVPLKQLWRDILTHSYGEDDWFGPAVMAQADPIQELVRITYPFVGTRPDEHFTSGSETLTPVHAKYRHIDVFDRHAITERIVWLPARERITLRLNGRPATITDRKKLGKRIALNRRVSNRTYLRELTHQRGLVGQAARMPYATLKHFDSNRTVRAAAKSAPVRERFQDAWVFIDRVHDADDSAEVLFRHIWSQRPDDVNPWFVIEQDTPDWDRLQSKGYGDRMVAYGTDEWRHLMLNCAVVISSHADVPIHRPPEITKINYPTWRFVFLQHGVIKDDLSNWLNPKSLDIFVTSTYNEQASVAGDGTAYSYTTKQAKLTELPRFDEVLRISQDYPSDQRDLILVGPTWRNWLVHGLGTDSQRRKLAAGFFETEYAQNWLGFVRSDALAQAAEANGLQIALLPHPNLESALPELNLPDHISQLSFSGVDVRSYFARSALFVTDYSSMAFNTAYIERPVMYFQFDQDRMFGGAHVGKKGYFDYAEQGFGPVCTDLETALDTATSIVEKGAEMEPLYRKRVEASFPFRDGQASQRAYREVRELMGLDATSQVPLPTPTPIALP